MLWTLYMLWSYLFLFQEMINTIIEETQHTDHAKYGVFVLVIMTHGKENVLYGTDGEGVHE